MMTDPNAGNTSMRWYVRTAGHHDAHHGALAMDGRVVARCGVSFTPQPDLFEPGLQWLRSPVDPAWCCPTCLTISTRQPPETQTEVDGAAVAGLIETL